MGVKRKRMFISVLSLILTLRTKSYTKRRDNRIHTHYWYNLGGPKSKFRFSRRSKCGTHGSEDGEKEGGGKKDGSVGQRQPVK